VCDAGGVLLTAAIGRVGFDHGLSQPLAPWRKPHAVRDPAQVVLDLAVTLALRGTAWPASRCCAPDPAAAEVALNKPDSRSRSPSGRTTRTRERRISHSRGTPCAWTLTTRNTGYRSAGHSAETSFAHQGQVSLAAGGSIPCSLTTVTRPLVSGMHTHRE
jgi:hypothetical protein